jgi:PBP1b-binding outer membrane lipoprotein LpoB
MKKLRMLSAILACAALAGACSAPITAPESPATQNRTGAAASEPVEPPSLAESGGFGMGGGG